MAKSKINPKRDDMKIILSATYFSVLKLFEYFFVGLHRLVTYNVLALGEEADFEALKLSTQHKS